MNRRSLSFVSLFLILTLLSTLIPTQMRPLALQAQIVSFTAPVVSQVGPAGIEPSVAQALAPASPTASTAASQAAQGVELVGQIGGETNAVAIQSSYAYVGVGQRLAILNIVNPASPMEVGKTGLLGRTVRGVAVAGDYAYVAAGLQGLRVINISNPSSPYEVAFCDTPYSAAAVAVAGGYAYVADGLGLRVVDVSRPSNPYETGFYDTPGSARDVAIVGNYAYIADGSSGLRVVNISTPTSPSEVGFYDTPGAAAAVTVAGSYAYIADGNQGLRVVSISNPSNPWEVGSWVVGGSGQYASDVAVSGSYAYIAYYFAGLRVVNIGVPSNPAEVGSYGSDIPNGSAVGVAISGNYAHIANSYRGLRVANISSPSNPYEVGRYETMAFALGLTVAGSYAYVADAHAGLKVIDVSAPSNPTQVGVRELYGASHDVVVSGNYAYVADGYGGGLQVVNISNPSNPYPVGSFRMSDDGATDVAVAGNYAYVTFGTRGLRVLNISSPANPYEVGFYDTPGEALGVALAGGYAYVADDTAGLRVVNVSTPSNPYHVGSYDTPGDAVGVAVDGSYAYVADLGSGLRVVDISVPSNPHGVAFFDAGDLVRGVTVADGLAHVAADGIGGLRVLNVSTPTNPVEVGFYDTLGNASGVTIAGGLVYVADLHYGLSILRVSPYSISGRVTEPGGQGIPDVTVNAGSGRWTVTDPDGAYDITDLPTGSYTLTPYKSGYTFSPASRIVTVPPDATGQDFVGLSVSELVYDGPLFLPWSAVLDEVDSRISMGDHVHLRLPFRNSTAQTMYNVQVEFSGALPMVGRPGVHVYNGTDWTSNALITLTPSDIPPGVTAHADFWIYVDNVEPEFRESLSGQTLMKAYYRDAQWVIPILLSPVSFDIDGNEDMTAWSCLHHPENFEIERYAQYAAGAPSMSTPPAIEGDPDTATQALRNLAAAVYREFPRAETGELRMPDFTLLERRGQIVGNCRHVADLTTGLARSLGLPTRYVMGLFSHPQPEKSGAHAWTEVYLPEYPDRDGWRQADAACDAVLLEGWYEDPDVGYTVERALADKYPLSSACMFAGLGCRCVHSCYEAPIDCPECLSYYWYSPTPWDIFCVENVKDDYHNLTPSRLQDLTEDDDALLVQAEATVFVTRTVPFGVSASIRNNTAATLNAVTASVSLSDTVLSTTQLFEPDPLYHTVPAIAPGETVDLTWEVTPLVAGSGLPLRVFALSDGLLGFDELPLVVGEPGSLPPLMVGGTCNTDQVSPGQSLTLTAYVLDESLQTLDNPPAEVSATVFFSPTTDFSETIAMVFDSVLQQYRGTLDLPIDAPAGRYDVDVRATCPGYSSAESQSAFWAAPPLEIGIDLSTDTIRPQETLTVTVTVQDRGELVAGAGVSADILLPGRSVRIPLLPAGEGVYVAAFRPADLSSELGGVWAIEATADYKGGSATAATSVLVLREIYLPLVLRNH